MSREARELIRELEQERQDVQDFYDELERQVAAGEITTDTAVAIWNLEYHDHTYGAIIAEKNQLILEAQEIIREERTETAVRTAPVLLILVLAIGLAWNFTALTGFFLAGTGENFYRLDIGQTYTTTTIIDLPILTNITSLRLDGVISGTGTANIWLLNNGTRFLVAAFDSAESTSLTGFVTAGDTNDTNTTVPADNITVPENITNETNVTMENVTNETNITLPQNETNITLPENVTNETNVTLPENITINETNITLPQNETNITLPENITPVPNETVVLPPTPPITQPAEQSKTQILNKECQQTCSLPKLEPPYKLEIEINGNIIVNITDIIYGEPTRDVNTSIENPRNETNVTLPENVTNETNVTLPENITINETNITLPENITINGTNITLPENLTNETNITLPENITNETLPENLTNATNITLKQTGELCIANSDCGSGVCKASRFQGQFTSAVCTPSTQYCVADVPYPTNSTVNDSTCYATSQDGFWLASSGQGRFEIKDSQQQPVAVIDKYGQFGIRGNATTNTTANTDGWVIKDASGDPRISIDSNGNLLAAGTITPLSTPEATASGDLIIKDKAGVIRAVLSETGNAVLAGEFRTEVQLS